MEPDVPIRLRVHPTTDPKPVPAGRSRWPREALICNAILDRDGALSYGVLLETFDRWTVNEHLVFPGSVPDEVMVDHVAMQKAHVMIGVRRTIGLVPTSTSKVEGRWDGLGYRLRDRGYRRGWPIVCAGLARQLAGMCGRWALARRSPGAWSMLLAGLGTWGDAPRIIVEPLGQLVVARWGSTKKQTGQIDTDDIAHRPPPKAGPFVDVLQVASALRGADVHGLTDACMRFGVEPPGSEADPIGRLRNEAISIAHLYFAEVAEVANLNLSLDLATLVSTGGIGTALLREAGMGR